MLETNALLKELAIHSNILRTLSDEEIAAIQRTLLEMMDDVHEVCEKYHLTYFLSGGSALGAVRHKGFIPWDEDIDLCMPRADYDRFARLILKDKGEKYWVQNSRSSEKYDLNFMKVRKKGTQYVEIMESDIRHAGIFIDVFPIENTYDNPVAHLFYGICSQGMLFASSCVRMFYKQKRLKQFASGDKKLWNRIRLKSIVGRMMSFLSQEKWIRITDQWLSACKDENSRQISIPSGRGHYFGEMYLRTSFFPPVKTEFEGRSYYIMNDPDQYLSRLYGNYMEIPPEDKRERHSIIRLNLNNGSDKNK